MQLKDSELYKRICDINESFRERIYKKGIKTSYVALNALMNVAFFVAEEGVKDEVAKGAMTFSVMLMKSLFEEEAVSVFEDVLHYHFILNKEAFKKIPTIPENELREGLRDFLLFISAIPADQAGKKPSEEEVKNNPEVYSQAMLKSEQIHVLLAMIRVKDYRDEMLLSLAEDALSLIRKDSKEFADIITGIKDAGIYGQALLVKDMAKEID